MSNKKITPKEGFAKFNNFEHQYIQCQNDNETISIRTKSGKRVTVSIIGDECADIAYHDSKLEPVENGSKQFQLMGFNYGTTPVQRTPLTIATILFNEQ